MRLNCPRLEATALQTRVLIALVMLVFTGASVLGFGNKTWPLRGAGEKQPGTFLPAEADTSNHAQHFANLPLVFESNQGQSNPIVKFLTHGSGYGLFLTQNEAVLALQHSAGQASTVRMSLEGANPNSQIAGTNPLLGKSNYLIGNDPAKWHRNVPQFAQVRYENVYPGIDLVYYGNQGRLEYDFKVAPGADPKQIALRFSEPEKVELTPGGALVLATTAGDVRLEAPRVYQEIGEEQRPIAGRFILLATNQVGFELGAYDRSRALIIDPVLTYSTYLGGSGDEGCSAITLSVKPGCPAIAVDSAGNAYVAGPTTSPDFPIPSGTTPFQASPRGAADIFVTKLNSTGTALIFATYLGGTGADVSAGVAADSGFNVVVAGTTNSPDFPTNGTNAAFQPTPLSAGTHAFVSKLDSTGSNLVYSTYISGSNGGDNTTGLALDVRGRAYVTGTTTATNFPATSGAFQATPKAAHQFFMSKIDPTLTGLASLAYSTYLGGSVGPSGGVTMGGGIAVDTSSTSPGVFVTGGTDFTDMPVLNASQGSSAGGIDAFVAKFIPTNASGTELIYLTYLGGSGTDVGNGVAVDSGGSAYVTGSTDSTNFPAAGTGVFQPANAGGTNDAFLAKFNNPASGAVALTYSTYLGGGGNDVGLAVAVDSLQGARVTGFTDSSNFHTQAPVQASLGGGVDAFAARIDTTATTATAAGHYSTYLGGSGNDRGTGIAVDPQGASYIAGETASSNFPTHNPFQSGPSGSSDAFVSKLGAIVNLSITAPAPTPATTGVGNQVSFTYTITNSGDLTTGVTFSDVLPSNATFVSASTSPGSCGTPTGSPSTVTCSIGTLNAGATATVTVVLTPTVAGSLGNSGTVTVLGSGFTATASASATVSDFSISVAPASATVTAGTPATYTVTVTPVGAFPNSVSLSCTSGLPAATSCAFTNNPVPNLTNGPQSSVLNVNTTARPPTTAALAPNPRSGGPSYATFLPICAIAFLGLRVGGSRKRLILTSSLLIGFFALILFQAGCGGSSTKTPAATTGTPVGTYTVTVTGTSGSASRTTTLQLVVQ